MADYIQLDEAAKLLNISVDALKEMIVRQEIYGLRDGASMKFKPDEIERVRNELSGDVLDDDPGGSSVLLSERAIGAAGSKIGSTLGGSANADEDSDLQLSDNDDDSDELTFESDVGLVADPGSGSGVRLVNKNMPLPGDEDDDEVLELSSDSDSGSSLLLSDLNLDGISNSGSGVSTPGSGMSIGSDSDLNVLSSKNSTSGGASDIGDLIRGDSDQDIQLDDNESDLVLGGDSALSLKSESGINLTSPSDSGLSLEDEPLDLAGTGISGLGLSDEIGSGVGSDPSASAVASGSASGISGIDFASAEDFQLSPSGGFDVEDDSGSQVIELEDSADFAGMSPDGLGGMDDANAMGFDDADGGVVGFDTDEAPTGYAVAAGPVVDFSWWEVGLLLLVIMMLGLSGILMTDIARNMWAAAEGSTTNLNSWISDIIAGALNNQA